MDQTQRLDPNRTLYSGAPANPAADPGRTQAMDALSTPEPGRALVAEIVPGRLATMANGPAREQFLVEFVGAGFGATMVGVPNPGSTRTPLNLCLVIDRSGSMEGAPLDYVKQACSHVVDSMSPNDVLSIVTFEETVDVLMPPQRVTDKQRIKDGIQRLQPGNTTNLYDGLLLAAQQVLASPDPGRATRLVVLTDGDPTAGIKDFTSLVNHAGEIKARGVTCTFLGFGPDYNEELLHAMAKRAGGNYYYIPRPELIPEVFRTELDKLMTVVARNLRLEFKTARWVTARAPAFEAGEIQLADLERGANLLQVFDFEFANHPLGWYRVASGKLTYDDLLSNRTETVDLDFVIEFTADAARYSVPVDPRVQAAAQVVLASKAVEKTVMGLKTGALSSAAAVAELQKTQALLSAEGRTAEAQEVTLALRALQSGDHGQAEKTLMGTMLQLDQGKRSS